MMKLYPADRPIPDDAVLVADPAELPARVAIEVGRLQDASFAATIAELACTPDLDFDPTSAVALEQAGDPDPILAMEREWEATWGRLDDPAVQGQVAAACEKMAPRP